MTGWFTFTYCGEHKDEFRSFLEDVILEENGAGELYEEIVGGNPCFFVFSREVFDEAGKFLQECEVPGKWVIFAGDNDDMSAPFLETYVTADYRSGWKCIDEYNARIQESFDKDLPEVMEYGAIWYAQEVYGVEILLDPLQFEETSWGTPES